MATFSTNNSVSFHDSFDMLGILTDPVGFSEKSASGFKATSSDLLPHVIEVIGTNFLYFPTSGTINTLIIKPPLAGTTYTITGLSLSYSELADALSIVVGGSPIEDAVAKIFENADVISGSGFDDRLRAYVGNDEIHAGGE